MCPLKTVVRNVPQVRIVRLVGNSREMQIEQTDLTRDFYKDVKLACRCR
jgi:hypothetical protein